MCIRDSKAADALTYQLKTLTISGVHNKGTYGFDDSTWKSQLPSIGNSPKNSQRIISVSYTHLALPVSRLSRT